MAAGIASLGPSRGRPPAELASAGPTFCVPSLEGLRPAARPLAECMHTPPHTPLVGAGAADLRGHLEEDLAGVGVGGPESG